VRPAKRPARAAEQGRTYGPPPTPARFAHGVGGSSPPDGARNEEGVRTAKVAGSSGLGVVMGWDAVHACGGGSDLRNSEACLLV